MPNPPLALMLITLAASVSLHATRSNEKPAQPQKHYAPETAAPSAPTQGTKNKQAAEKIEVAVLTSETCPPCKRTKANIKEGIRKGVLQEDQIKVCDWQSSEAKGYLAKAGKKSFSGGVPKFLIFVNDKFVREAEGQRSAAQIVDLITSSVATYEKA